MKKKIYMTGKVYDLATTSIPVIEKEIRATIFNWIGVDVPVRIIEDAINKQVRFTYHRGLDECFQENWINEDDHVLILGDKPKHTFWLPHFPNMKYRFPIEDFTKLYKDNAKDAGANRIKELGYEGNPNQFTVTIRF